MGQLLESLGIDWLHMLIYAFNIGVLILIFRFLVFKPLKTKIIEPRRQKINEAFQENEKLNAEALAEKQKYEQVLVETRLEAARIAGEVAEKAKIKGQEILLESEKKAEDLLVSARSEIAAERKRLSEDYAQNVSELALDIAEKILEREVSQKDNQKIIDDCVQKWSSN